MMKALPCLIAVTAAFVTLWPASVYAADLSFNAGGVRVHETVRSLQEIRQARTVRQRWDISCGPAALSTLLTHHYGDAVSETAIMAFLLRRTDPARIRAQRGFSLLDLKHFAVSRGYEGKGYGALTLKELAELGMPAIVPIHIKGYSHFVVFREMKGDRVILADPAFGATTMKAARFLEIWEKGIGFIVLRQGAAPPRGLTPVPEEFLVLDDSAITRASLRMNPIPLTRHGP